MGGCTKAGARPEVVTAGGERSLDSAAPIPRTPDFRSPLFWVGLGVTVAFGYFAIRDVRFVEAWDALRSSNYWWVAPATVLLGVAVFLRAVRWQALFAESSRPPLGAVTRALLIGHFFNNVLPLRAGEAARVLAVKRFAHTSRAEAAATVVLERIYDVLSLVALLFIALAWLPEITWIESAVIFTLVVVAALAAAVVVLALWHGTITGVFVGFAARFPFMPRDRGERAVSSVRRGLAGLMHAKIAARALAWTLASWGVMAVSFWLVMLGFDLGLSPAAGLLVVIATSLSLVLPSSPAAVGVFEAATIVALDAYGVPRAEALSYALVLHAVNFLPFIVAGAVVMRPELRERARRRVARTAA
jgi:glycosyltransferase 2 family protein